MPRDLCHGCEFPVNTCVCDYITPYTNQVRLYILQHPKEVNHAKNTVKLLRLTTPNVEIYVGEEQTDFGQLAKLVDAKPESFALLYPSEQAQVISPNHPTTSKLENLIVIDGTWRKAKKMYLTNPWLQNIPHLSLSNTQLGDYTIRKTSIEGGLSTLEAIAYALYEIDDTPPNPLLDLFEGFQTRFMEQMPVDVQSRYKKNGD